MQRQTTIKSHNSKQRKTRYSFPVKNSPLRFSISNDKKTNSARGSFHIKSASFRSTKTIAPNISIVEYYRPRKRQMCEISAMQLEARRGARRASFSMQPKDYSPVAVDAQVPLSKQLIRENCIVRWNVFALVATMIIQSLAIFWNMFSLWSPDKPEIWNNNWQTNTSKSIITITCIMLTIIVAWLRFIDLRQLPEEYPRTKNYIFIALECLFIMIHIPPGSKQLGFLDLDDDLWNILGTAKWYLLSEVCKIKHPLWLRRYEAAAARIQSNREPYIIGSFFCFTGILSQFDPIMVFSLCMIISLGMFTMWIYFIERTRIDFSLSDTMDYILSAFFKVPAAANQTLRTLTGRTIKLFTGMFSMCYGAIIGWTFGFRVAENTQTMADLLDDVNAYINYRHRAAKKIQKWWRRIKGKLALSAINAKPGEEQRWSQVLSSARKEKLRSIIMYSCNQNVAMADMKLTVANLQETNEQLLKSNKELSEKNGQLTFANKELERMLLNCIQAKKEP